MADVFRIFLRLGLTSFGGPIAHLGYFRREFVERRQWIDAATFADLIAFCSVLPGPTSSQVGMLIGLSRAGPAGALASWIGFTGPSAILMTVAALVLQALNGQAGVTSSTWFNGMLAGLTAAAAAVVAQAVLSLARTLCTERRTQTIAIASTIMAIAIATTGSSNYIWAPILIGAIAGYIVLRGDHAVIGAVADFPFRVSRAAAIAGAVVFFAVISIAAFPPSPVIVLLTTVMRAGALVFGGGHVVLPLLQGLVTHDLLTARDFFAGYGVVQAMPGPLFSFSAFVGAANSSPLNGVAGAIVCVVLVFVPPFALVFALAPAWNRIRTLPGAAAALRGANASVVGLLAGVLFHPILTTLMPNVYGVAIALIAYALIEIWKTPPWTVVAGGALLGAATGAFA